MQEAVDMQAEAPAVVSGPAVSGSGQTPVEIRSSIYLKNERGIHPASPEEIPPKKPAAARPWTSIKRKAPGDDIDDFNLIPPVTKVEKIR